MQLRVGVIGLGMMGKNHARVLSSLEGVELAAFCDPVFQKREYLGKKVFETIEEVIAENIDYAVVCVPTSEHLMVTRQLAEAGIHCLIEKPISADLKSAREIVELFRSSDLKGAIGHIERFNPAVVEARKRLDSIGEIFQISTRRQGPFPGRISDVGVVKDLATHDFDLTAWLTGSPYSEVYARVANKSGRTHEDLVAVTAQLRTGVIANHLVNWISPQKDRCIVLIGEKGSFQIDTLNADLVFSKNGEIQTEWSDIARFRGVSEGDVIRYSFVKKEPLQLEHEEFRNAILDKQNSSASLEDGLHAVMVAEAVIDSARSLQSVRITP